VFEIVIGVEDNPIAESNVILKLCVETFLGLTSVTFKVFINLRVP